MTIMPDAQIPGIVITLKDVYEEQRKNTQDLGRQISDMTTEIGRFSGQLSAMDASIAQGAQVRADHEARLRALERWRYALPLSAMTAAASLGLALAAYLHG